MRPNRPHPSPSSIRLVEPLTLADALRHREREERSRTGLFYCEGARFLMAALANRARIVSLVVAPRLLPSAGIAQTLRGLEATIPTVRVSATEFALASTSSEPQGIGLFVEQTFHRLVDQPVRPHDCWVALDEVRSSGNFGSILRTGEATGTCGAMLLGGLVDPYDPGTVRATMGALFSQRLVRTSAKAFAAWKQRSGALVVGASLEGRRDYRDVRYSGPVVVMMGSERNGIRPRQQALCDELVRIPMSGPTDSLNLSVATGLMLYEVFNQRRDGERTIAAPLKTPLRQPPR